MYLSFLPKMESCKMQKNISYKNYYKIINIKYEKMVNIIDIK